MGCTLRILIVEDIPTDAELVERELGKAGIEFTSMCVDTRDSFLQQLEDFSPHIVLSDYSMPGFDGIQALELVKERYPSIPFILVTGPTNEEIAVECMKRGAADYVLKENLRRIGLAVKGTLEKTRLEEERKKTEEALKKSEAQLLQAQKMEAIGNLAGGVAHDFNNLLQAIIGYAEMLLDQFTSGDPRCEDLKEIQNAAFQAASLTRQLLAFSRRQPLQPKTLNLNEVVTNIEKMLRRLIGEDITLVAALAPELENVTIDPGQIEQVIMNLAVNARDVMPEGGRLTIKTENVCLDEEYCKVFPYARPGEFVSLLIEDSGAGMDEETIEHIFEPFFTTKGPGEGTGLGLSVVYGIVKQHEGWINVHSEPGQGTAFSIYLPTSSVITQGEVKDVIVMELEGKGERILLVEDEDVVREVATRTLDEKGYVVITSKNSQEALDIFEREKGDFHLVLSDVVLPDRSGIQLVEQLLSRKPELQVILSSGYTDHKLQWPIIQKRGFRFIQKPYKRGILLQAVREALESGQSTDSLRG